MIDLLKDYWEFVDNAQQEDIAGDYDLDQITMQFIKENNDKLKLLNLASINNSGAMVCDHSHGFYFDENGIITCVKCHPPKDKQTDC